MIKKLLIVLLTINSIYSLAQSANEKIINQLTDLICDCASKAKDMNEFELCEKISKTAEDSIEFTFAERMYFLQRIIKQCDAAFDKFLGERSDSLKIQPCLFFQEEDLMDFNVQKSSTDRSSIDWTGKAQGQIMKELYDERKKFTSDSLAIKYINKQRELTESEGIKATTFSIETFQTAEAFNFGDVGNYYLYHVYARKGKLVCFLVVSLTKDDLTTIKNLLERLSTRLRSCK